MPERRPRLCIVNPFQHGGGAEYQIGCLLDVLIPAQRCEVFYLAHHVEPAADRDGCTVVKIGQGNRVPRLGYVADVLPLYRALRHIGPDVIYQRVACGYTGISAWYARRNHIRSVWHVAHDTDVMPASRNADPAPDRNPLRRWLEKTCVEYGARHAGKVVTQTEHQARLLEANYGRHATAVIPNFQPPPLEAIDKSGPVTVVWVANFKRWKRPEVFVRLASALHDLDGVRFVMVGAAASGSGDARWGAALLQNIRATPNLSYLGTRSQQQVNELLATSHVLVNTSVAEGFANTFIQAWLREMPVVSLDVDPDDILVREDVGIRAGSEERLAQAVRQLAGDAGLRRAFGTRAQAYASARHSLHNAQLLGDLLLEGRGTAS
jgi:glycosyltransferase involved in cell wall biosynthesis